MTKREVINQLKTDADWHFARAHEDHDGTFRTREHHELCRAYLLYAINWIEDIHTID